MFGPLKFALRQRRSVEGDEPKHRVSEDVRRFSKKFDANGMQRLMPRWKKCVDSEVDSWKNNFNFVKGITMIYSDLIIALIMCSQKNDNRHYFLSAPNNSAYGTTESF
jgi:hypothetical protein